MLETGETDKVNEAAKAVGISRSAFYKYRDDRAVPEHDGGADHHISADAEAQGRYFIGDTFYFCQLRANILTINQARSVRRTGMVTVSAETGNLGCSLEEFTRRLGESTGVVKAKW